MIFPDPSAYYDPEIQGIYEANEEKWLRFGKGHFCPIVLGQVVNNRYRILSLLGSGSYGMVWLAVDEHHWCVPADNARGLHIPADD